MINKIIPQNKIFNYYFDTIKINKKTLNYFDENIKIQKTKNEKWITGFLFENLFKNTQMLLPINYLDTNNFKRIPENYLLLKLNPLAIKTYVFDSPIEMLYYYQLNTLEFAKEHQFISFFGNIKKEEISQIIDLAKDTKIHTVFSKKETYGKINDIRFALANDNIKYQIYQEHNAIKICFNNKEYIIKQNDISLHKLRKITKRPYSIRTIKPKKGFLTFKEIIHHD